MTVPQDLYVHSTALVEETASIGEGTKIWHHAHIRRGAQLGARCVIGKGVFVDFDVAIGDDCKIQNYACVYHGVTVGRGVFIGPHVVLTNDLRPRAVDGTFHLLADSDWELGRSAIGDGASIGANSVILPGVQVAKWAMIGASSTVTRDVLAYSLVLGSPARHVGWVCVCGQNVETPRCARCGDLPSDHPLLK